MPQDNNQIGMSQGPFTQYLQGYAQRPAPQAQPGITTAGGVAHIASAVLDHIRNYRIQDYMMKEQQRERQEGAYKTAIMMVQNSNLGSQAKSQMLSKLMTPMIATIAGEKPGQAEQTGGNPIIAHIRQYASNLFGGGVPKQHVNNFDPSVIEEAMHTIGNPALSKESELNNATAPLYKRINEFKTTHNGASPSQDEIAGWDEFRQAHNAHAANGMQFNLYSSGLSAMPGWENNPGMVGDLAGKINAMKGGGQAAAAPSAAPPQNTVTPSVESTNPASPEFNPPAGYHPGKFLGITPPAQDPSLAPTAQAGGVASQLSNYVA